MTLYRGQIRDAMVVALRAADTLAGDDVYAPRDWPTEPVELPAIIISTPAETKTNMGGPFGPKFNTTATIVVLCRLIGSDAMDAEAQLEIFADQVLNVILTDFNVLGLIEKFSSVETQAIVTDAGEEQVGELSMAFGVDFPEIYQPGTPQAFVSVQGTVTTPGDQTLQFQAAISS